MKRNYPIYAQAKKRLQYYETKPVSVNDDLQSFTPLLLLGTDTSFENNTDLSLQRNTFSYFLAGTFHHVLYVEGEEKRSVFCYPQVSSSSIPFEIEKEIKIRYGCYMMVKDCVKKRYVEIRSKRSIKIANANNSRCMIKNNLSV